MRKIYIYKGYIFAAAAFLLYYIVTTRLFGFSSPSMIIVGLPCPACGMTRAARFFITGNFARSFAMHPLFIPTAAFMLWAAVHWLRGKDIKKLQIPLIILLVTFFITYFIRMWLLFPHQEPLVANSDALLHNILNLFINGG